MRHVYRYVVGIELQVNLVLVSIKYTQNQMNSFKNYIDLNSIYNGMYYVYINKDCVWY
jgi:hypothetical protein